MAPHALEGEPGAWLDNILLQITVRSFMDTTTRRQSLNKNEAKLSDSGYLTGRKWVNRAIWLQIGDPSEKGEMNLRKKK